MDRSGLEQIGVDGGGVDWVGVDAIVRDVAGLCVDWLGQDGLIGPFGRSGLGSIALDCARRGWIEWMGLDWIDARMDVKWLGSQR